jgi:hypothetical protein
MAPHACKTRRRTASMPHAAGSDMPYVLYRHIKLARATSSGPHGLTRWLDSALPLRRAIFVAMHACVARTLQCADSSASGGACQYVQTTCVLTRGGTLGTVICACNGPGLHVRGLATYSYHLHTSCSGVVIKGRSKTNWLN